MQGQIHIKAPEYSAKECFIAAGCKQGDDLGQIAVYFFRCLREYHAKHKLGWFEVKRFSRQAEQGNVFMFTLPS